MSVKLIAANSIIRLEVGGNFIVPLALTLCYTVIRMILIMDNDNFSTLY